LLATKYQYCARTLCVLGSALVLSGCANPYALVSHVHPHLTGAPGVGSLAAAERAMTKAMHEQSSKALIALADCLTALQNSIARARAQQPLFAIRLWDRAHFPDRP